MSVLINALTSWRTSLSAIITALFLFVLFSPEYFQKWPWLISLAKFAVSGGLVSLGINGKDGKVTGGSIAQQDRLPQQPPAEPSKIAPTPPEKGDE